MAEHGAGRRSKTKRWLVSHPRSVPLLIFLLITGVTLLSIFSIERGENLRKRDQLHSRTIAVASALERRANSSSAYLRAGAALLASVPEVSPELFDHFVSELRLNTDYGGTEGIGWAPTLRASQIAAFEAQFTQETGRFYTVSPRPDGTQPYLVPTTYLYPDTVRNRRATGFDMFSEPTRRAAMLEAERTSRPTATRKVVLKQETDNSPGFLIYMPVFEETGTGRQLKGFIYSPFNAAAFLGSALELEDAGSYVVRLYDGNPPRSQLLASTEDVVGGDYANVETQTISIADIPWALQVASVEGGGLSGLSLATLVFGLLVASLLMMLVRMLTQQALEDEASLIWFEEQASIRNSLTRELNHRVKNTLANVLSIIALTRRRATSLEDFANGLDGRVRALSATHDLLTNSQWGSTPLRAVAEAELLPYAQGADHVVDLQGPVVALAPSDALSLGLALHELATNAAKYGALSKAGGQVSVHWRLTSENLVRIEWLERGGPLVPQQRGRGFGTDLIERIVAHELRTPVKLVFEEEGVRCVLMIPVRRPTKFDLRARNASEANTGPPLPTPAELQPAITALDRPRK